MTIGLHGALSFQLSEGEPKALCKSSRHPKWKIKSPDSIRETKQGMVNLQACLMVPSTHSIEEFFFSANLPSKAQEKDDEQVSTTALEIEMVSLSPT